MRAVRTPTPGFPSGCSVVVPIAPIQLFRDRIRVGTWNSIKINDRNTGAVLIPNRERIQKKSRDSQAEKRAVRNHRTKCESGFTVIEIMIATGLIGLLAAIAIPNFIRSRTNSQMNACISNLREINAAVHQWSLEQNKSEDTPVQFADISAFLKRSVVCPAGGTSFADSYLISVVGEEPDCQLLPSTHLLQQLDDSGVLGPPSHGHHGHGQGQP